MKKVTIQGKALSLTPSGAVPKESLITLWADLKPGKLKPEPIPYKHTGTTIDQDGIRICGSPEFIGAVMERLKDLLEYEAQNTRLGVAFSQLSDKSGKPIQGRFRCAIQVHERGRNGAMVWGMFEPAEKKTITIG